MQGLSTISVRAMTYATGGDGGTDLADIQGGKLHNVYSRDGSGGEQFIMAQASCTMAILVMELAENNSSWTQASCTMSILVMDLAENNSSWPRLRICVYERSLSTHYTVLMHPI